MKSKRITLIALAFISLVLIYLSVNRDNLIRHMSFKPFKLQTFILNNLKNEPVEVSNDDGKPKLLIFWASWCPTCKDDLQYMIDLDRDPEYGNLDIYAISVDDSVGSALLALSRKELAPDYHLLLDPENEISKRFEVYGVPETFIVDKNGQVVKRFIGPVVSQIQMLIPELKKIVKN